MNEFTDNEKIAIAKKWVEILGIRKDKNTTDRYITSWGNKTLLGIYHVIVRLVEDQSKTHYLMNPATGSVDTRANWVADMGNWSDNPIEQQRQFDTLIEVKRINDEWVEV